jgi:hypothetical protein
LALHVLPGLFIALNTGESDILPPRHKDTKILLIAFTPESHHLWWWSPLKVTPVSPRMFYKNRGGVRREPGEKPRPLGAESSGSSDFFTIFFVPWCFYGRNSTV